MKVLILSTDDFLGAGKAALRINRALIRSGHIAKLIVKNKTVLDDEVVKVNVNSFFSLSRRIASINSRLSKKVKCNPKYYYFGYKYHNISASEIFKAINFVPDVIIITWISGFISPKEIKALANLTRAKILAYPLDMSLFTGGCHYAWDCNGYLNECNDCPAILNPKQKIISHKILKDKLSFWKEINMKVVVPTAALLKEAKRSKLFGDQTFVPQLLLPIDELVFNAKNRRQAKKSLNIPENTFTILFGASYSFEERKGLKYFLESVNILREMVSKDQADKIRILIVGKRKDDSIEVNLPFKVVFMDYINDDNILSVLYQASDVFVTTCIQDSGPMMVNESIMCGTPVVSFDIGVSSDLIVDGYSGYKAPLYDAEAIALAIYKFLSIPKADYEALCKKVAEFGNEKTSFEIFIKNFNKLNFS